VALHRLARDQRIDITCRHRTAGLRAGARRVEPVFIAGFFRTASGLGELARLLYGAYARLGVPVFGMDLTEPFRQGADVPFALEEGRAHRGAGTVILAVKAPFVPLALNVLGRKFLEHKWRIGYWAWELPTLPPARRAGAQFVDEIWAISNFAASAMERGLDRLVLVVLPPVIPHGFAADSPGVHRREANVDFVVLTAFNMASSFARKNPLAAIAAFKAAFAHDSGALLLVMSRMHPSIRTEFARLRMPVAATATSSCWPARIAIRRRPRCSPAPTRSCRCTAPKDWGCCSRTPCTWANRSSRQAGRAISTF
jgi:hypothetical protein